MSISLSAVMIWGWGRGGFDLRPRTLIGWACIGFMLLDLKWGYV